MLVKEVPLLMQGTSASAVTPGSVQPCRECLKSKIAAARRRLLCTPYRLSTGHAIKNAGNYTQCFKASSQCNTCGLLDVTHSIPPCWLTVRSVPRGYLVWLHEPQLEFSETWHKPSVSAYAAKVFSETLQWHSADP